MSDENITDGTIKYMLVPGAFEHVQGLVLKIARQIQKEKAIGLGYATYEAYNVIAEKCIDPPITGMELSRWLADQRGIASSKAARATRVRTRERITPADLNSGKIALPKGAAIIGKVEDIVEKDHIGSKWNWVWDLIGTLKVGQQMTIRLPEDCDIRQLRTAVYSRLRFAGGNRSAGFRIRVVTSPDVAYGVIIAKLKLRKKDLELEDEEEILE